MEITTIIGGIHWIAVLLASVAAFAIGSVWYSPVLFSKVWQKEVKLSDQDIKGSNMALIFGLAFVLMFISALVLDIFLPREATALIGMIAGLLVSVAWIATALGVNYLFARRSFKLFLIDAGYYVVFFAVMGLILGAW